MLLFSRTD